MTVMTTKEIEEKFGVTEEQLDAWEKDASEGVLHGEPRGEVLVGRPLMFGEPTRQVGFKEPLGKVKAIDQRANMLGMKRSDYLRSLVDADLELAGML